MYKSLEVSDEYIDLDTHIDVTTGKGDTLAIFKYNQKRSSSSQKNIVLRDIDNDKKEIRILRPVDAFKEYKIYLYAFSSDYLMF